MAFVQNHVIQDDLLYEVKVFTDGRTGEVGVHKRRFLISSCMKDKECLSFIQFKLIKLEET